VVFIRSPETPSNVVTKLIGHKLKCSAFLRCGASG
jgi:hypothetical protein